MRFLLPFLLSWTAVLAADKLLFASVLWRHGQRAPSKINGVDGADVFHRGQGELTDAGRERSKDLGRALRRRYVQDNKLLTGKATETGEFKFHSTARQRCIDTMNLVARGLFGEEENEAFALNVVPTPFPDDYLIGFTWFKCAALGKVFKSLCNSFPDITTVTDYHEYEKLSFKCSKAGKNAKTFTTPERGLTMESVILLADSGAITPEWMTPDLVQEAREVYSKVLRFQLGLGEFRNETILKQSVGLLLTTIIEDMKKKWSCRGTPDTPDCKLAFKGYSTHDYILNSLLELLGAKARNTALEGFFNPQMSAAILVELWEMGGVPKVKVLYRPYALAASLRDLSTTIAHCKGAAACDITTFESGYASFATKDAAAAVAQCAA